VLEEQGAAKAADLKPRHEPGNADAKDFPAVATLKDIAITPTRKAGARRRSEVAAPTTDSGEFALSQPVHKSLRTVAAQPTHRFHIGEKLKLAGGGRAFARGETICKVVGLLPYEGRGTLQYRVRGDTEQYERVVAEIDLSRA
jgi:hypothetical protein